MASEFTKKMIAYGSVAALAAFGGALLWEMLDEDEDRPPIIVGNGSIKIEIDEFEDNNDPRGNWERTEAEGTWHHFLSGKKPVVALKARAKFTTEPCNPPNRVDKVTITYAYGQDDQGNELTDTIELSAGGAGGIRLTPSATSSAQPSSDRVTIVVTRNAQGAFRAVDIGGTVCRFTGSSGHVRIQQKYK